MVSASSQPAILSCTRASHQAIAGALLLAAASPKLHATSALQGGPNAFGSHLQRSVAADSSSITYECQPVSSPVHIVPYAPGDSQARDWPVRQTGPVPTRPLSTLDSIQEVMRCVC